MSDGFLSRWSRRKRGGEPTEPEPVAPPEAVAPEAAEAAPWAGVDDALSPEELAELPSLDALTAETDVTAFLRKGVPRALRNAALRRAWAVDPQVRDFVCEAREYAYDWNVPGGVPGNGDMLPTDDVAGMLRRIFGDEPEQVAPAEPPSEVVSAAPDGPGLCDPVSQSSGEPSVDAPGEGGSSRLGDTAPQHPSAVGVVEDEAKSQDDILGPSPFTSLDASIASQPEQVPVAAAPIPKRRHGGAAPI